MRNIVVSRIAMWAGLGLFVSVGWGFFFATINKALPIEPAAYVLALVAQPAAGVALSLKPVLHLGLGWVVAINAATYALLGLVVEMIRRHRRSLCISN